MPVVGAGERAEQARRLRAMRARRQLVSTAVMERKLLLRLRAMRAAPYADGIGATVNSPALAPPPLKTGRGGPGIYQDSAMEPAR